MGEFGSDKNFPIKKSPSSKPLLGGANVGPDGAAGIDAVFVASQANNILIPSDFDGGNPVLTNAITEFEIWRGNTLLANKSSLDGWTSQVIATNGVSIDDTTDLEATVTVITQDEADFVMQFDKVGFTSITAKIYVKKVKDGEKGDTGDTGAAGGTGPTGGVGPTGADGTGLVVVKKEISMLGYSFFLSGATNSGGLLFSSSVDHDMIVGDTVHHYNYAESSYEGDFKVTEIVSSTSYRVDGPTFVGEDGGNGYSLSGIRDVSNSQPQDLEWWDVMPDGNAFLEWRLIMITPDNDNELYAYLGWKRYPESAYNSWLNGELFENQGDQRTYPATIQPYLVRPVYGEQLPVSLSKLHLRLTPYAGKNWDTNYANVKFNLFSIYISLQLDTYGT